MESNTIEGYNAYMKDSGIAKKSVAEKTFRILIPKTLLIY